MISAKRAAKQLLHAAGYEVRRKRRAFSPLDSRAKQTGWLVEFLGPSGIGKTTLLRACSRRIGTTWVTRENSSFSEELNESAIHHLVFKRALESAHSGNRALPIRAQEIKFADRLLRCDQACLAQLPYCTINDEGLVTAFGSYLRSSFENGSAPIEQNVFFRPRAFLLLSGDPDMIVRHIRDRQQKGRLNISHRSKSDEELATQAGLRMDALLKDVTYAAKFGSPVERMNVGLPLQAQIDQVMAFLDQLANDTCGVEERTKAARRMLEP